MRQLAKTFSLLYFLDELEFSHAALDANPETADLAPAVAEEIEAWPGVFQAERLARRNVIRADAVVAVRDLALDDTTRRFGSYALAEAGGDRRSGAFHRFFATPVSAFVRGALRKQCEQTLNVIVPQIEALGAGSPLASFGEKLRGAATSTIEALDARARVKAERGRNAHDTEEWKDGVNRLRTTLYAELLKRAAEHGHPPREFADAFFRVQQSDAAEEAPESPATPA